MTTWITFWRKGPPWRSVLLILVVLSQRCSALDPQHHIAQYGHSAWRLEEGFFDGAPSAIAQTSDGYLWIGTSTGLVRFDGARFVPWRSSGANTLYRGQIFSLLASADGSLWVGSLHGLSRLKDGIVTTYADSGTVRAIVEDGTGTLWIARSLSWAPQSLCEVIGSGLRCYGENDSLPQSRGQSLTEGKRGEFWIGPDRALYQWKQGHLLNTYLQNQLRSNARDGVIALAQNPDGTVWAGTAQSGVGLGLQRIQNGVSRAFVAKDFDSSQLATGALLIDKDHSLWIGTLGKGLFRIHQDVVDHFGSADGLSSDSIESLFEDREGTIWVVTAKGIDTFHAMPITTFSMKEGLSSNRADGILASRNGPIYVSNLNSLDVIGRDGMRSITQKDGLPGTHVSALLEDRDGRLWLGVDQKLVVYDGHHFRTVYGRDGKSLGVIMSLAQDTNGDIWAATHIPQNYLIRVHDFEVSEETALSSDRYALSLKSDPTGGLWLGLRNGGLAHYLSGHTELVTASRGLFSAMVASLFVDEDGTVWGTTDQGLIAWRDGSFRMLGRREGLPCDSAFDITRDSKHNLWVNTPCGLVTIHNSDLLDWWQHSGTVVETHTFNTLDGFQAGSPSFEPGFVAGPDGHLWWANGFTVQTLDPDRLVLNKLPPSVHLESVVADGKSYPSHFPAHLPPLTRNLEIDYTATSFINPRRVQFRYRLIGHDSDWQEAGTRRQAFYTALPPGNYSFKVIARNNDGVWNTIGDETQFTVARAYYQTPLFRAITAFCGAMILWLLYRMRLSQVREQMQTRLSERLVERERIARELHDYLLQGVQGLILKFQGVAKRMTEQDLSRTGILTTLDRAEEMLTQVRDRVKDLRSEEQSPQMLEKLLADYAGELEQPSIRFQISTNGLPWQLHPIVLGGILAIGREAISNAFHHSRGSQVTVEIIFGSESFQLLIRDDGIGIERNAIAHGKAGHWGLQGMREHADEIGGKVSIQNCGESGLQVELVVPAGYANLHSTKTSGNGWVLRNGGR
jgi:signal transduction histidine kinase/streptogramin lyase